MFQLTQLTPSLNFNPNIASPEPQSVTPAEDVLSLFVSDLAPYATEEDLHNVFHFPMDHLPGDALGRVYIYPFYITDVRMVTGSAGSSRYAFVRFPSIAERTRALYIMQGVLCLGRPIRLSRAHAKDRVREKADLVLFTSPRTKQERQRDNIVIDQFNSQWASVDPKNTKVFVGGISPRVFLQEVVSRFANFGTLTNVNFGKGCAFISFARKGEAAAAIQKLDGMIMDGKPLRVTWSRSSVQPLLQQQRTIATSPPGSSSEESTPDVKFTTNTPSSPPSPITPITPFGSLSFPQLANGGSGPKGGIRVSHSRSGSISSKASMSHLPNLYPLREVDESPSPLLDLAPSLARRQTVANITRHRAGLLDQNMSSFKAMSVTDLTAQPAAPNMGRRVSLPDNAL